MKYFFMKFKLLKIHFKKFYYLGSFAYFVILFLKEFNLSSKKYLFEKIDAISFLLLYFQCDPYRKFSCYTP